MIPHDWRMIFSIGLCKCPLVASTCRPLILDAEIEVRQIVADGGGHAVGAVEVGEVVAALHVDVVTGIVDVEKILIGAQVFHISEEEVGTHFGAACDV